jgi:hypothetical protein
MKSQSDDPPDRDQDHEVSDEAWKRWNWEFEVAERAKVEFLIRAVKSARVEYLRKAVLAERRTIGIQGLLSRLISPSDANALLGDLDERHQGRKSAAYWRQFMIAVIPLVFVKAARALRLDRILRGI